MKAVEVQEGDAVYVSGALMHDDLTGLIVSFRVEKVLTLRHEKNDRPIVEFVHSNGRQRTWFYEDEDVQAVRP